MCASLQKGARLASRLRPNRTLRLGALFARDNYVPICEAVDAAIEALKSSCGIGYIFWFCMPSATENGPYDYTRSGNPTRDVLESLLAKLDKADRAFCFTSGMAALAAVAHLVGTGEEIVAGDDIYGGSDRLLSQVIPKTGVMVKRINTTDLDEVASAIGPRTKLVWLESPTNPRQQISDIRKIAEIAHAHAALVLVDNSIMSPVLSQPLELGADIVMHSATKFIAGHSDVMAGVLAVKGERLYLLHSYPNLPPEG
ncbi:hypothetical protein RHMOL_Rhmol03G0037900 [Rhododendron molle]|nr:hypothetical protein RHMOL_Rhmol03G0037900 [Rhododendron molle]